MSLFMVCVYTHGGYLMVKMTPSPDVEDYDNEVPTRGAAVPATKDKAKADDLP